LKKKYLFLLPYPPPFAGPEIIAKEILESTVIQKTHNSVFVKANIRNSNKAKGKFDFQGLVQFIKVYLNFLKKLPNATLMFSYISSTKIGFIKDTLFMITAKLFLKKVVVHYHGANFFNFYENQTFVYKNIIKTSLLLVDKFLVLGENLKAMLKGIIVTEKIGVLYNGLNLRKFDGDFNNDNNSPFTILFMGHLWYPKGFYDLIIAYKLLYNKYNNNIQILFAGENTGYQTGALEFLYGASKDKFEKNGKKISLEISDFIDNCREYHAEYLGVLNEQEKLKAFQQSDVFVLPSYTEGFSMACLEAMAMGLPVVTTPVGAMPEFVKNGENGLITEIGNPKKLADDIDVLIKEKTLREMMGRNNIKYVQENFDIEVVAKRLIKILDSIN